MAEKIHEMDQKRNGRISLVDIYRNFLSQFTSDHLFYLQICGTILIGLIILYLLTRRVVRSVSGRSVVLVGGCEAGKTALLYRLSQGSTPVTVTSFKENLAEYATEKKSVRLVDVPGHERVRDAAFDRHKADARAIVFVLDSATLNTNVRDVAEQLFVVLSDATVQRSRCPVAVVCNKQDHELAKGAAVIERALQREIDVLRETSSSRLASIDANETRNVASLGTPGQAFQFTQITTNTVTFLEASVRAEGTVAPLKDWIEAVA